MTSDSGNQDKPQSAICTEVKNKPFQPSDFFCRLNERSPCP